MSNYSYTIQNKDFIISSGYPARMWVVHDKEEDYRIKRVKHHLKGGDYCGTLATILDLMDQITDTEINTLIKLQKDKKDQVKKLKSDLLYLQKHYRIVKKE